MDKMKREVLAKSKIGNKVVRRESLLKIIIEDEQEEVQQSPTTDILQISFDRFR